MTDAGFAPDQRRNALYELSRQLLQLRDLSSTDRAVKLNRTFANAGRIYNTASQQIGKSSRLRCYLNPPLNKVQSCRSYGTYVVASLPFSTMRKITVFAVVEVRVS